MWEALFVIVMVAGLAVVGFMAADFLMWWGLIVAIVGLGFGTLAGAVYHAYLRAALKASPHGLPARWWINPVKHHGQLDESAKERFRPWFWLGAAGFVVAVGGCLLAACGVAKALFVPQL